jgi:hypothetical protein
MTCTANATKIANPVSAARMMYVLVLKLTAIIAPSPRHPWLVTCARPLLLDAPSMAPLRLHVEATSGSARKQSRGDD